MNIPNLIEIQRNSFGKFLQLNVPPDKRKNEGLQLAFLDIFPISNIDQTLSLEFVDYTLEQSRYTEEECIEKDDTYAMSLKIKVKLNIQRKTKGNPETRTF